MEFSVGKHFKKVTAPFINDGLEPPMVKKAGFDHLYNHFGFFFPYQLKFHFSVLDRCKLNRLNLYQNLKYNKSKEFRYYIN